ncbi:phage NrS-1 polymerase family protein [Salinigranum halophilum]|jgi:primase-polymerase (primpol)-like protein|uniref:phage NrS-1 polymerase family protein n=1 Tax=Salinigranum halophilum TaxID=2565931 RepID=UPI00115CB612|nr:hypothetical protein [Salinigranum halophilum]
MSEELTTDDLPAALLDYDQWVCWQTEERDDKQTKIPINPTSGRYASTTDSTTWAAFEEARQYAVGTDNIEGLGFVFTDNDPFVGVDLDNCRDDSGSPKWATDIIEQLDAYTEISPSGTGYHLIVTGKLPSGPNRRDDVECYETARYFTVTGNSVHDPPRPVAERTAELAAVHAEYVAGDESKNERDVSKPPQRASMQATVRTSTLDDETIIEKARAALNGSKFERLWNGSTSGYDSHSEADMALCFMLAFWTGGDVVQMDRLFRQSGLLRGKWDEVHFADGSTYGEKTLERAVARVDEFYEPPTQDAQRTESAKPPTPDPAVGADRKHTPQAQDSGREQHERRLMATIDRLEARVDELEAENDALRDALDEAREARERPQGTSKEKQAETPSLWTRVTARFGSGRDD